MKISYKIQEQDFLAYQLYEASKSERIRKSKRNNQFLLMMITAGFSVYFLATNSSGLAAYFAVLTALIVLFYPKLINWKHKKDHQKTIQQFYAERFGEKPTLEITNGQLLSTTEINGEQIINFSEIEAICETQAHFFVKLSEGGALIVPKKELGNPDQLKQKFSAADVLIWEELDWEWA